MGRQREKVWCSTLAEAAAAAGLTVDGRDVPAGGLVPGWVHHYGNCPHCRSPRCMARNRPAGGSYHECGYQVGIPADARPALCVSRAEKELRQLAESLVSAALRVRQKTRSLVSRGLLSAAQLDALEALATAEAAAAAFLGRPGAAP